jgi:hypothetical protein
MAHSENQLEPLQAYRNLLKILYTTNVKFAGQFVREYIASPLFKSTSPVHHCETLLFDIAEVPTYPVLCDLDQPDWRILKSYGWNCEPISLQEITRQYPQHHVDFDMLNNTSCQFVHISCTETIGFYFRTINPLHHVKFCFDVDTWAFGQVGELTFGVEMLQPSVSTVVAIMKQMESRQCYALAGVTVSQMALRMSQGWTIMNATSIVRHETHASESPDTCYVCMDLIQASPIYVCCGLKAPIHVSCLLQSQKFQSGFVCHFCRQPVIDLCNTQTLPKWCKVDYSWFSTFKSNRQNINYACTTNPSILPDDTTALLEMLD